VSYNDEHQLPNSQSHGQCSALTTAGGHNPPLSDLKRYSPRFCVLKETLSRVAQTCAECMSAYSTKANSPHEFQPPRPALRRAPHLLIQGGIFSHIYVAVL